MTIEVRQILIKASVTKHLCEEDKYADSRADYAAMKAEILEDCKRLIVDLLREERER